MMWLRHGVRLVWLVHPATRAVEVHHGGSRGPTLVDGNTLDGGDVLPGFTCAVSDIFGPYVRAIQRQHSCLPRASA